MSSICHHEKVETYSIQSKARLPDLVLYLSVILIVTNEILFTIVKYKFRSSMSLHLTYYITECRSEPNIAIDTQSSAVLCQTFAS